MEFLPVIAVDKDLKKPKKKRKKRIRVADSEQNIQQDNASNSDNLSY